MEELFSLLIMVEFVSINRIRYSRELLLMLVIIALLYIDNCLEIHVTAEFLPCVLFKDI